MTIRTKDRLGSVAGSIAKSTNPTNNLEPTEHTITQRNSGRPRRETPAKRIHLSLAEELVE